MYNVFRKICWHHFFSAYEYLVGCWNMASHCVLYVYSFFVLSYISLLAISQHIQKHVFSKIHVQTCKFNLSYLLHWFFCDILHYTHDNSRARFETDMPFLL